MVGTGLHVVLCRVPPGHRHDLIHLSVCLQKYCRQRALPDGDLMSVAKILEFALWFVDEAVQPNGTRYSFSSVR